MEWDVGGLACTVAADVERNLGGRRSCSGLSPAMQVVGGGGVDGAAKNSRAPLEGGMRLETRGCGMAGKEK